jgi:hypothetical protein
MVILVSEDSNRYAHLFRIEREYFGFNTLESVFSVTFFWWKLIDRNFLLSDFYYQSGPQGIPPFCSFHCIARDYLQTGYSDMLDISVDIIAPNFTNFYHQIFKIF